MGQGARAIDGGGLRPAELRAGGSLPVRLEPRGRPAERGDGHREGRPCPALSQPHDLRAGLRRRWCSTPTTEPANHELYIALPRYGKDVVERIRMLDQRILRGEQTHVRI